MDTSRREVPWWSTPYSGRRCSRCGGLSPWTITDTTGVRRRTAPPGMSSVPPAASRRGSRSSRRGRRTARPRPTRRRTRASDGGEMTMCLGANLGDAVVLAADGRPLVRRRPLADRLLQAVLAERQPANVVAYLQTLQPFAQETLEAHAD